MTGHPLGRLMSPQRGLCRRGQCKPSLAYRVHCGVDDSSTNRVLCRAQKHRTVIEISSDDDDDDDGETTPAVKTRGR